jgi:hypothetical protein
MEEEIPTAAIKGGNSIIIQPEGDERELMKSFIMLYNTPLFQKVHFLPFQVIHPILDPRNSNPKPRGNSQCGRSFEPP